MTNAHLKSTLRDMKITDSPMMRTVATALGRMLPTASTRSTLRTPGTRSLTDALWLAAVRSSKIWAMLPMTKTTLVVNASKSPAADRCNKRQTIDLLQQTVTLCQTATRQTTWLDGPSHSSE